MNQIVQFSHNYPFLVVLVSLTIGYLFMPVVIKIAKSYNFVVSPNKRTSHNGNVPNIGGLNIFISFLITVFLFSYEIIASLQFVLMGLFVILIIGFIDDLINIKASTKLLGELVSGFFLIVIADIRLSNLHGFLGIYEIPILLSYALSFFVFIVVVNAMNLIDGIDGLASGLGILYSLFFAIYFQFTNHLYLSIAAYTMVGSLIVFFIYNVFGSKSKIFMGDSGSLLLGYLFNVFVFSFCEMNANGDVPETYKMNAAPAVAFTILIVLLFDTLRVMGTRIKKGYSPFKADKNHLHHLLLLFGLKHRQVSFILMSVSVFFIALALIGRNFPNEVLVALVFVLCVILTKILWILVGKKKAESLDK
ncbi:MAG TPA: undecaprenyl/decaprenyl-phosphate alpha-N-acetylglucosaminyl 1-phosphate transferase [Bacteroidales bacterium]|nr:undecaprenyl/decaprenyl-phosphate alpha-N-acetylglucosaminyl 1-phosphate transferase [Bacteroidales bacterium]